MSSDCTSLCASADFRYDTGLKTHKVTYVWAIKNFSFYEAIGDDLKSPTFSAVGDDETIWFLRLYPNGKNEEKDHISFFLTISNDGIRKKAFAKLSIYFLKREMQETPIHNSESEKIDLYDASIPKGAWGWDKFIKKDAHFRNNFLIDDTLTIKCVVIYATPDTVDSTPHDCSNTPLYSNVPECNLTDQFGSLLENHNLADVVLSINGTEYPAHKTILSARSPVFAAMFRHKAKENEENRVYIEDMDEKVVGEMLRYIYTGKCEKLSEFATGLLAAADKYDLVHLKMICAEELYRNLSVENAASVLALADMHGVKELKNAVIKFIVRKPEVVNTDGWKSIRSNFELADEVCLAIARRARIQLVQIWLLTTYRISWIRITNILFNMSSNCISLCGSSSADIRWDTGVKTHEVVYVWTIKNFSFYEAIGDELKSSTFSAVDDNEIKWYLKLYPNGESETKDTIYLYLNLSDDIIHKEAFAKVSVYVLDTHRRQEIFVSSPVDSNTVDKYAMKQGKAKAWGWGVLVKDDDFRDDYLIDDTLTIKCVIVYSTCASNTLISTPHNCNNNARLYPNVPECNLSDQFGLLLENRDFADVILSINGIEYPAHKYILAARSPVFAAMFKYNARENEENRVNIEDMDEKVVGEMLRYIYTGKCGKLTEFATGLLEAADKYDLVHLKMICAEELYKTVSVENAADILALADMHGVEELKKGVIKFIVSKPNEVLDTVGWKNIRSNFELADEVSRAIARQLALKK
ncbi:uncharacterized protein LOC135838187 [Planococcus citri]|uniref:uncharacterized protein LOC135838187 n=1 Tax=Planococcus citri TaxID=170843 RepID=UPI0031F8FB09